MADRTVRIRLEALVSGFQSAMQNASRSVTGFGSTTQTSTRRAGRSMSGLVGIAAGVGVGVAAGLGRASSAFSDFEESAIRLRTQIGLTAAEADEMSQAARNVGRETGIGAQEAVDASFFIQSSGLRGAEAMDALERSAQAARIGLGETEDIARLTTAAVNAYGEDTLNAEEATDQLLAAVKEGSASAPEFAGAMGQVLPIASEMGVSFGEVAGNVAAMTRTGTDAGTAVIQLRQMMMGLINPTEGARDALSEVGLSAQGLRDMIREDGLFVTLMHLRDAFGDNEEAMSEVFGNARSLMGVLDLLGANSEENARIVESVMTDAAGGIDDAVSLVEDTTADKTARMSAHWDEFVLHLGERVVPAVNWALDDMNRTMERGIGQSILDFIRLEHAAQRVEGFLSDIDLSQWFTGDALNVDVETLPPVHRQAQTDAIREFGSHLERMPRTFNDAADAADGFAGSQGDVAAATDEAASASERARDAINNYLDDLRAATDPVFALHRALGDVEQAQDDYNEAVKEYGSGSAEAQDAAMNLAGSLVDLETAALDGDLSFSEFERQLERWVDQGRISQDEADELRGRVAELREESEEYAGEYMAHYRAEIDQARIDAVNRQLDGAARDRAVRFIADQRSLANVNRRIAESGGSVRVMHQGGLVRKMHSGGMVGHDGAFAGGLRPDEVPIIAQTGERVLSREQTRQFDSLMRLMSATTQAGGPVFHSGGVVGESGSAQGDFNFSANIYTSDVNAGLREAQHRARIQAVQAAYG